MRVTPFHFSSSEDKHGRGKCEGCSITAAIHDCRTSSCSCQTYFLHNLFCCSFVCQSVHLCSDVLMFTMNTGCCCSSHRACLFSLLFFVSLFFFYLSKLINKVCGCISAEIFWPFLMIRFYLYGTSHNNPCLFFSASACSFLFSFFLWAKKKHNLMSKM